MTLGQVDAWFSVPFPKPAARFRLFCFPYAGGGASAYFSWAKALRDHSIDVRAIQLPGRETRLLEPPYSDLPTLVESLGHAMQPLLDLPYVFFGHSLGALVAFELTRWLRDRRLELPAHLFVSGAAAPNIPNHDEPLHPIADDDAFITAVATRYGGIPQIVLDDVELRSVIMPALRADLEIHERYVYREADPFTLGISAYGGTDDPSVLEDEVKQWRNRTTGDFSLQLFAGDHFFLNSARPAILADVMIRLMRD